MLTANIGILLDLYGVERGLDHFRSTNSLSFDHYLYYLKCEVFGALPNTLTPSEVRSYETRIAEVCWLVCRKPFLVRERRVFKDESVYQIFRIFNVFGETDKAKYGDEVRLHPVEAAWLARTLANSLGTQWDEEEWRQLTESAGSMKLNIFVALIEARCLGDVYDIVPITEAVNDMYRTLIQDVIKKGYLLKRGYLLPTFREYWFVLQPSELIYYKTRSEKDRSGTLILDPASRVDVAENGHRFTLLTSCGTFELSASDHMSRQQWVSALRLAVEHSGNLAGYQRALSVKRRQQRASRAMAEQNREQQLLEERAARQAAEGRAGELEATAKDEARKAAELEEVRATLERLLEEETQARRDEETVRALQARVLTEEWERREELERLQHEQKALLELERCKRFQLEYRQREAERRLRTLEEERMTLDHQLRAAHSRIQKSEESREVLEARLKVRIATLLQAGDCIFFL